MDQKKVEQLEKTSHVLQTLGTHIHGVFERHEKQNKRPVSVNRILSSINPPLSRHSTKITR